MSTKLILGTLAILLLTSALAVYTLVSYKEGASGPSFSFEHEFPATIPLTETMTLPLQQGSLEIVNFLSKNDIYTDKQNTGYYYLGNNSLVENQNTAQYSIFYIAQSGYFNITLLQKPLGQARTSAEIDLMSRLGINQEQMCSLRYSVSVPVFVDEEYTSRDLGFKFCQDNVNLP